MGADARTPPAPSAELWLRLVGALSPSQARQLLDECDNLTELFACSPAELRRRLPTPLRHALLSEPPPASLEPTLRWLEHASHHLVTWIDDDYPSQLREIGDPPLLLFVHGDRQLLARPQLAIVGSRHATADGESTARAFAETLAQAGLTITSGLALGIDGAAHRGALAANGRTIAVVGNGLDRVYPAAHHELAHLVAQHGALVSEYPLGFPPRREHFPQRNRIISGLSLGVLVVEAAARSGSLITARLAGDQGREVFAVPGSIHSPHSRGCHALIRQGAKLVETAQDILEELRWTQPASRSEPEHHDASLNEMEPTASKLWSCLGYDPVDVDTLADRSGLTADCISSILLIMELRGLVEARPGGRYLRTSFKGGR